MVIVSDAYAKYPEKIIEAIKTLDFYKSFTYLDKPDKFSELFKDRNFDRVEVFDIYPICIDRATIKDIVGFSGVFKWKDNTIISIDYDSYNKNTVVYGYKEFTSKDNTEQCIIILVLNDW